MRLCRLILCLLFTALVVSACNVAHKGITAKPATSSSAGKGSAATTATKPKLPSNPLARAVLDEADKWVGTPYKYGQETRGRGTDCSGFVMQVYDKALHIALPRNTRLQSQACRWIGRNELQPGDLVFFAQPKAKNVGHVGIYTGAGQMIHASSSRGVMYSRLDEPYWAARYDHGGRVLSFTRETPQQALERRMRIQAAIDAEIEAMLNGENLDDNHF